MQFGNEPERFLPLKSEISNSISPQFLSFVLIRVHSWFKSSGQFHCVLQFFTLSAFVAVRQEDITPCAATFRIIASPAATLIRVHSRPFAVSISPDPCPRPAVPRALCALCVLCALCGYLFPSSDHKLLTRKDLIRVHSCSFVVQVHSNPLPTQPPIRPFPLPSLHISHFTLHTSHFTLPSQVYAPFYLALPSWHPEKKLRPLSPNDLQRFPPENAPHPRTFRCSRRVGAAQRNPPHT
jgi:hypothetical protein